MTQKPVERTVDEIVEEFEEKIANKDFAKWQFAKDYLTQTLKAERQRCDEIVEVVKQDLQARMEHPDYIQCSVCEETMYHLQALTHPNNPK